MSKRYYLNNKESKKFNIVELEKIKEKSGVYAFWHGKRSLYVGKASNVKKRLLNHYNNTHNDKLKTMFKAYGAQGIKFSYSDVPKEKITNAEKDNIERLQPQYNKQGKK